MTENLLTKRFFDLVKYCILPAKHASYNEWILIIGSPQRLMKPCLLSVWPMSYAVKNNVTISFSCKDIDPFNYGKGYEMNGCRIPDLVTAYTHFFILR